MIDRRVIAAIASSALLASPASAQSPIPTVYVRAVDYPAGVSITAKDRLSLVKFVTAVDGRVPECEIVRSSGERLLDVESCRILTERAHFATARLGNGGGGWRKIRFRWLSAASAGERFVRGAPIAVSPESWLTSNDYPSRAQNAGEQGVVWYEADVAATSKVRSCTVVESSGSASLDARTCEIVQERGVFIPASDGRGASADGKGIGTFDWRL